MARKPHPEPIEIPDEPVELDIRHGNDELLPGPSHPGGADEAVPSGKNGVGAVVVHHSISVVLLVLITAIGTWAFLTYRHTGLVTRADRQAPSFYQPYAVDAQQQRLAFALEVYQRLNDRYPSDLASLVDAGLLQASDLHYPPGRTQIQYRRTSSEYRLDVVAPAPEAAPPGR